MVPLASTGLPDSSTVRQPPMLSKFSSVKPNGSIIEWQLLQVGFVRCCDSFSRIVLGAAPGLSAARFVSTPAGGGGTPTVEKHEQKPWLVRLKEKFGRNA